jgi:hypothetical protein
MATTDSFSTPLAPLKGTEPRHPQLKSKWVAEKWVWNPKHKLFEWLVGHFEKDGDPQITVDDLNRSLPPL